MGNKALECCARHKGDLLTEGEDVPGGTNRVELASSELFRVPAIASAYHTSVLVNGEEFFFSDSGVFSDRSLSSHQGVESEVRFLGYSTRTGAQLLRALSPHFRPGTYDLLRKNCNSFSDCALFFLLKIRLERKYAALERLGINNMSLVQQFTKGAYIPNPAAESFKVDRIIAELEEHADSVLDCADSEARSPSMLMPGTRVTLIGLINAQELNGLGATIVGYNNINGRWEARLDVTGEVKALRAENVLPAGELALEPGKIVRVHGLRSEAGRKLNGKEGQTVRYRHDVSRYEILIDGELKAVKADNLQDLSTVK